MGLFDNPLGWLVNLGDSLRPDMRQPSRRQLRRDAAAINQGMRGAEGEIRRRGQMLYGDAIDTRGRRVPNAFCSCLECQARNRD
jgi:hypothetical protein